MFSVQIVWFCIYVKVRLIENTKIPQQMSSYWDGLGQNFSSNIFLYSDKKEKNKWMRINIWFLLFSSIMGTEWEIIWLWESSITSHAYWYNINEATVLPVLHHVLVACEVCVTVYKAPIVWLRLKREKTSALQYEWSLSHSPSCWSNGKEWFKLNR